MIEASKLRQTAWHTLPGDEVVGELGTDPDAGLSGEEAEERLTLAVFYWMLRQDASLEEARSVAMTQMVMFQFFHVFNSRSLRRSAFRIPLTANPFLAISMALAGLAHLGVLYLPGRVRHRAPRSRALGRRDRRRLVDPGGRGDRKGVPATARAGRRPVRSPPVQEPNDRRTARRQVVKYVGAPGPTGSPRPKTHR
ncbi:MAG: cation transporting ATPase C-terminal domain-containing protein [Gemmatimonadota bacterium]